MEENKIKYEQLYNQLKNIQDELEKIIKLESEIKAIGRKTIQINDEIPLENKLNQIHLSHETILQELIENIIPDIYQKKQL